MLVLGLQGSPRKNGNTHILLSTFLKEAEALGARTQQLRAAGQQISPCRECGTCERKGFCAIEDDMQQVYPLLWEADLIVLATPIFFYGPTAQIKALIDRSQALWARKYTLGLTDPGRKWRKGLLLAVGATKGKTLFDGTALTAKYFFDAVGAGFEGTLGFRQVENAGDIQNHPTALKQVTEQAGALAGPYLERKKILFVCTQDACTSQMAGAFARFHAGDRVEAMSGGSAPADEIDPVMVEAMAEKGIDMAYLRPQPWEAAARGRNPDLLIVVGDCDVSGSFPGVATQKWDVEDPRGKPAAAMRRVRDQIEERVTALIEGGL